MAVLVTLLPHIASVLTALFLHTHFRCVPTELQHAPGRLYSSCCTHLSVFALHLLIFLPHVYIFLVPASQDQQFHPSTDHPTLYSSILLTFALLNRKSFHLPLLPSYQSKLRYYPSPPRCAIKSSNAMRHAVVSTTSTLSIHAPPTDSAATLSRRRQCS